MSRMVEEQTLEADSSRPVNRSGPRFDFSPWESLSLPSLDSAREGPSSQLQEFDFTGRVISLLALIILAPLMLVIALAIKVESPRGPVFYRQERIGLDRRGTRKSGEGGKPFNGSRSDRRMEARAGQVFGILKFRTMIPDAEAATGPVWASEKDPRITRVGRVLRHLRLDELPQLVNVVRGQMRLIGPRPERAFFIQKLSQEMPDYCRRLTVPPGITGLAQVEREYDADVDDVKRKLGYDLFYVDNRCRILDLKILLKTVDVVIRGRGSR